MTTIESLRRTLLFVLHVVLGRRHRWRTLTLLLLAGNVKNLPLVWHYRMFHAYFLHILWPHRLPQPPSSSQPYSLFLPVITSSRAPALECDYNIHKSNSTYFSDLDVSRVHLITLLCAPGLPDYRRRKAAGEMQGNFILALGAVACFFRTEIKPYEAYEMWSRVLCWDQKWVYIVTHFVKKGAVSPAGFLLQPKRGSSSPSSMRTTNGLKHDDGPKEKAGKEVFAFALSKYVYKSGRRTLPPEIVFERCGLMPPRPAVSVLDPSTVAKEVSHVNGSADRSAGDSEESINEILDSSLTPLTDGADEWTWDMVERERQRGMKIASQMAGLDELKDEFTGDSKPALGVYRDLLWA